MYDYLFVFTLGIISAVYLPSKVWSSVKKTYCSLRKEYPSAYSAALVWKTSEIYLAQLITELKKRQGCQSIEFVKGDELVLYGIRHDESGVHIPLTTSISLKEFRSLRLIYPSSSESNTEENVRTENA